MRITKRLASLAAMIAMALTCWAPSATAAEFHSETEHTIWSGTQVGELVEAFKAGTWRCNQIVFSGTTATKTSTSLRASPFWSECTAFGFVNVKRDVNGCEYVLNGSGTLDIACPAGKAMVITGFNCHITVPPQTGLKTVSYTNSGSGSGREVTADLNVSGIEYSQTSIAFPGCTNGSFTNGSVSGSVTFAGLSTVGEQVGVWAE